MERLKVLGTWVLLVIAFYLFSHGLIYVCLQSSAFKGNTTNNTYVENEVKK